MDEQQFREEEETELSKQKEPWEDDGKKRSVSADLFDWAEALVYALAVLVVICAFLCVFPVWWGLPCIPPFTRGISF